MLASAPAFAAGGSTGGGAGGSSSAGSVAGSPSTAPSTGAPQQAGGAASNAAPGKRKAVEDSMRQAGALNPTTDKQELRSLNQISRQIAPGVAVPAPEVTH